jgi:hypothetical protein
MLDKGSAVLAATLLGESKGSATAEGGQGDRNGGCNKEGEDSIEQPVLNQAIFYAILSRHGFSPFPANIA